jgi:hypothetical protein
MSALYSQGSKYYVKKASKNWDKKNRLLMFFKTIIFKMKKHSKLIEKMYKKIKPEIILFKLIEQTKNEELLNNLKQQLKKNYSSLGSFESYIYDLYKFLQVKVLSIFYLHNDEFYSNLGLSHDLQIYIDSNYKLNDTPDILIVFDYRFNVLLNRAISTNYNLLKNNILNKKNIKGLLKHEDIITFNGIKYKLDSVIIVNYNAGIIQLTHAITGITCNNNRYVYNGWSSTSTDPAIIKINKSNNNGPCSLMKYNWNVRKNEEFCLNPSLCKLDFNKIDKKDLCFSFKSDRITLIYVRVDETKDKISSSTTKEIKELSNIKDIIANIHDLENLSKEELKELFYYISNVIPEELDNNYVNKADKELREYLKDKILEYYYYFDNSLKNYIEKIDNLSLLKLRELFLKLNKIYKNLNIYYLTSQKTELLNYLKNYIKDNYKSDSKSSILVKKDKSISPILVETKGKYTKKQCDDWITNKLVNPITGRKILQGKSVYNDLMKHCTNKSKSPIVEVKKDKSKSPLVVETKGKYSKKQCDDWIANKLVNPITKRKILQGKPVYNDLMKHCTNKSKSPIVEVKKDKVKSKSKSPLVIETKGKYSKKQCDDWIANKLVNPITKRKIQEGKSVYNDFNKNCL